MWMVSTTTRFVTDSWASDSKLTNYYFEWVTHESTHLKPKAIVSQWMNSCWGNSLNESFIVQRVVFFKHSFIMLMHTNLKEGNFGHLWPIPLTLELIENIPWHTFFPHESLFSEWIIHMSFMVCIESLNWLTKTVSELAILESLFWPASCSELTHAKIWVDHKSS